MRHLCLCIELSYISLTDFDVTDQLIAYSVRRVMNCETLFMGSDYCDNINMEDQLLGLPDTTGTGKANEGSGRGKYAHLLVHILTLY